MFLFGYNYGGIMLILHMLYPGFGKGLYMVYMKRCYRQYHVFINWTAALVYIYGLGSLCRGRVLYINVNSTLPD